MTGCDQCNSQEPVDIVLVVNFNVSQLTTVGCLALNFTEVTRSIISQITIGGILVRQAGGNLVLCGQPTINCTKVVRTVIIISSLCHYKSCRVEE